jgi:hypothetical protein
MTEQFNEYHKFIARQAALRWKRLIEEERRKDISIKEPQNAN